jgi:microcystin-dependent protein
MTQRWRSVGLVLAAFVGGAFATTVHASCGKVESACADETCPAGEKGPPGPQGPIGPAGLSPPGSIVAFAGAVAPEGWLLCDGAEVSREDYKNLFDVVGITFGPGDAIHTFELPDLRARFVLGAGDAGAGGLTPRTVGEAGGEEKHVLSIAEMPAHHHQERGSNRLDGASGGATHFQDVDNNSFAAIQSQDTGGGQAHNTMPPFVVLSYIIKI